MRILLSAFECQKVERNMERIFRYTESHKDTIYRGLRIGATVWMLFLMLIYALTDYTIYIHLYDVVEAMAPPWLVGYYVQTREFVLYLFTATYLY